MPLNRKMVCPDWVDGAGGTTQLVANRETGVPVVLDQDAYVIQPDQTVQPRNIEVEHTEGDLVIVAKGLQEGEQVVVDGQNQLRAGAKVMPRQAGQPARPQREGEGPRADTPRTQRGPRQ